jgi:hypothetical protein
MHFSIVTLSCLSYVLPLKLFFCLAMMAHTPAQKQKGGSSSRSSDIWEDAPYPQLPPSLPRAYLSGMILMFFAFLDGKFMVLLFMPVVAHLIADY